MQTTVFYHDTLKNVLFARYLNSVCNYVNKVDIYLYWQCLLVIIMSFFIIFYKERIDLYLTLLLDILLLFVYNKYIAPCVFLFSQ